MFVSGLRGLDLGVFMVLVLFEYFSVFSSRLVSSRLV